MLVKVAIPNKKTSSFSDFKTKIIQCVRFQIKTFTTRQILKQSFHNVSEFKSETLRRVRFQIKKIKTCKILKRKF